ncbi:chloramphenicol resistance protein [Schnuerera sp.]|uniref:chloramphenicol resistance protein n=1 Tax=Schnuerera sp. TaxID=2794844 RepID=UPI002BE5C425|nr:chloramphenicol resistance protein [Schnuerera sp.]HSH35516.1 chloramphenicol resistance protein [Schnuerera sp.]
MMIIKSIRKYFLDCPILDEFIKIGVDYLDPNEKEYTIDPIPSNTVIKEYIDGGRLKQYLFVFASREFYGDDVIQNIENSGFYEKLSSWVDNQSKKGNLPILSGNKKSIELKVTTSGYLFNATEDRARYQIQMQLVYYEEE